MPYITHPVAASAFPAQYVFDRTWSLPGCSMMSRKDAGVPPAEIAARFGPRAAELVSGVSGEKERGGEKTPRRERKEAELAHLREAEPEVLAWGRRHAA